MSVSMDELCGFVRNYFLKDYRIPEAYIHKGSFRIANGRIQSLPFLVSGQWFRIKGSRLNDGVYQYPNATLQNEEFEGQIWEMYVPTDFESLRTEINDWLTNNADALNGPFQSESFGGYSYNRGYVSKGSGSVVAPGWQTQFSTRLSRFRRLSVL